jgi:hypothetical protein
MNPRAVIFVGVTAGTIALCLLMGKACAPEPDLDKEHEKAGLRLAERKAKYDLNCDAPKAETIKLFSEWLTVGVSGCGKSVTYTLRCPPDREGCL